MANSACRAVYFLMGIDNGKGVQLMQNENAIMARVCLRGALVVSAVLAGLLFSHPARAESALEFAATRMIK